MAKKATQKKNENKDPKKPKFNSYWIYIGIIVIFLGVQLFGGSGFSDPEKTSPAQFEKFLKEGDVDKVNIIKNSRIAEIFLTTEAKSKPEHSGSDDEQVFASSGGPDYSFEFGDLQNFENTIEKIKEEKWIVY